MCWCERRGWRRCLAAARRAVKIEPDLKTAAVVAAHPAAVMLALVAAKLQAKLKLTSCGGDGDGAGVGARASRRWMSCTSRR